MTIQSISQSSDSFTVRHFPLLVWLFIGVTCYGIASIVAAMLAGRQPSDAGTFLALAMLGGFTLFVAVTGAQVTTAHFDRRAGTVRIRRYGLLGRAGEERPLADVVGLNVRVLRRSQHRLELRMKSGELLPLTPHYIVTFGSGGIFRLAAFLGVDPEIISAQPVRGPGTK